MRRLVLTSLVLCLIAGCGGSSYLGRGLSDVGAYFNSYYNATNAFQQGVAAFEDDGSPVDRTRFFSVFPAPNQSRSQDHFESAIAKSADVLRDHPSSHLVDDAVLLIGKSYFYLQNYVGAEQKFREVVELANTPLEGEARYWLARTLAASGVYQEALESVRTSLQEEDLDDEWVGRLQLVQAELHVQRSEWEDAVTQLTGGIEHIRDSGLQARASFLLGQVYERQGRYDDARRAYRSVLSKRPAFELTYAARLSALRVQGLHGDTEGALALLSRLRRDDKYYANRAELMYLEARLLQEQNKFAEALETYRTLLYDEDVPAQEIKGRAHYSMAHLYREGLHDFMKAAAHFDTAASTLPSLEEDPSFYAPVAITDAAELSASFGSYAEVRTRLHRMDSLLALGAMSNEEFQEAVMDMRRKRAAELEAQQQAAERRERQQQFGGQTYTGSNEDETQSARATASGEGGFLYHRDPLQVREGLREFYDQWGDRPLAPNWRRQEALRSAGGAGQDGRQAGAEDLLAQVGQERLPQIDIGDVPRSATSRTRMRAERALARYEMGSVLFMQLQLPDSAAVWYQKVVREDAGQPIVPRAYYALAEVEKARGNAREAERLHQLILKRYPQSGLARRIRDQTRTTSASATASDSLKIAHEQYAAAAALWQRREYSSALDSMMVVAARHHETAIAPQALLAASTLFLEWSRRDSLSVDAPLPISLPDSLRARLGIDGDGIRNATKEAGEVASTGQVAPAGQSVSDSRGGGEANLRPDDRTAADQNSEGGDSARVPNQQEVDDRKKAEENPPRAGDVRKIVDRVGGDRDDVTPGDRKSGAASVDELQDASAKEKAASDEQTAGAGEQGMVVNEDPAGTDQKTAAPGEQARAADETGTTAQVGEAGSALIPNDTTASATRDSVKAKPELTVQVLLAALVERYPQTRHAERAGDMLQAIKDRTASADTAGAPVDTMQISADTTQVPADTGQAPADTIDVPANTTGIPADTTHVPADTARTPAAPADTPEKPPVDTDERPIDSKKAPADSLQQPATRADSVKTPAAAAVSHADSTGNLRKRTP